MFPVRLGASANSQEPATASPAPASARSVQLLDRRFCAGSSLYQLRCRLVSRRPFGRKRSKFFRVRPVPKEMADDPELQVIAFPVPAQESELLHRYFAC